LAARLCVRLATSYADPSLTENALPLASSDLLAFRFHTAT
jgi:hypothetical protein